MLLCWDVYFGNIMFKYFFYVFCIGCDVVGVNMV